MSPSGVKAKTMNAALSSTLRAKTGWLRIKKNFLSRMTCLPAECSFSELT